MKWMLSIIFALSILMEASAYDGSFDEGLDGSGSYIDYSYQDETNLISNPLYTSDQYYSSGSQPEPVYGYNTEFPYGDEYSTPYSLWIVANGQMTPYLQCPIYTQLRLISYSPGGWGTMSEIYPDGHQTSNPYHFETGNTELTFVADEPGRHTLGYEINGQLSNVVIIDVVSYGGEAAGPSSSRGVNYPPEVSSVKASLQDGYPGAAITFTAYTSDQDNDPILYKFWIAPEDAYCSLDRVDFNDYQPVTDWTTINSWTWYPQESDYGHHAVMVDVRDGSHEPPESWDDFNETEISICHQDPSLVGYLEADCPMCYHAGSFGKGDRKASRPKTSAKLSGKTSPSKTTTSGGTNGGWN